MRSDDLRRKSCRRAFLDTFHDSRTTSTVNFVLWSTKNAGRVAFFFLHENRNVRGPRGEGTVTCFTNSAPSGCSRANKLRSKSRVKVAEVSKFPKKKIKTSAAVEIYRRPLVACPFVLRPQSFKSIEAWKFWLIERNLIHCYLTIDGGSRSACDVPTNLSPSYKSKSSSLGPFNLHTSQLMWAEQKRSLP